MPRTRMALVGLVAVVGACGPSRQALMEELEAANQQLHGVEAELAAEEQDHAVLEGRLEASSLEAAALERRLAGVEQELVTKSEALAAVQADRDDELEVYMRLTNALQALTDAGTIAIMHRKGNMVVALQEAILFSSGRASLTSSGKRTLVAVTQALSSVRERKFMVAGHTDNRPIRTTHYRDNLELSSERAANVVRFMIQQGFPRQQIVPAGFGETDPLEDNGTEEGRAKNRRIDIILMPDLSKILELPPTPSP